MVSFASPSYLGLERHPHVTAAAARAVRRCGMTTATPRALLCDPFTRALERGLAAWVGQPAALVFPSCRHAAGDALPALAGCDGALFVDAWAYPTSLEGAREAERRGARLSTFPHDDVGALARRLAGASSTATSRVVVVDGIYVAGGRPAPLAALVRLAREFDAIVYLDDSHGLGPFGGGLLRRSGLSRDRVVVAGTLTKSLGVPVAFVAGETALMRQVEVAARSFVHDSPPSIPNVAAACAALSVEAAEGCGLRARLRMLVDRFRDRARRSGVPLATDTLFPVQTVLVRGNPGAVMRHVLSAGIRPALQAGPPDFPRGVVLRFFVTARHTPADIDRAVDACRGGLSSICRYRFSRRSRVATRAARDVTPYLA